MGTPGRASQYWLELFIFPIRRASVSGTQLLCSPEVCGFENSIVFLPAILSHLVPDAGWGHSSQNDMCPLV